MDMLTFVIILFISDDGDDGFDEDFDKIENNSVRMLHLLNFSTEKWKLINQILA